MGQTALTCAVPTGSVKVVELLLRHGASVLHENQVMFACRNFVWCVVFKGSGFALMYRDSISNCG